MHCLLPIASDPPTTVAGAAPTTVAVAAPTTVVGAAAMVVVPYMMRRRSSGGPKHKVKMSL